jgi:hypothetical protein
MLSESDLVFMKRIAAIHEWNPSDQQDWPEGGEMDLGRAESEAMIESYLGPDYPRSKVEKIVHFQSVFREAQEHQLKLFDLGDIGAAEYVARVNAASDEAMMNCFEVLGEADFAALFGGSLQEVQRNLHLDREAFDQQQQQLMLETSAIQVRGA